MRVTLRRSCLLARCVNPLPTAAWYGLRREAKLVSSCSSSVLAHAAHLLQDAVADVMPSARARDPTDCGTPCTSPLAMARMCVQVSQNMLTPNLHVAVCRLLDQELARGPMARELEFFMERYMLVPKKRSKHKTVLHSEITYLKVAEMIGKALLRARSEHGCLTMPELVALAGSFARSVGGGAGYDLGSQPGQHYSQSHFMQKGQIVTRWTRKLPEGTSMAQAVWACMCAVGVLNHDEWLLGDGAPLEKVQLCIFTRCQLPAFEMACDISGREGRAWQSSFALASVPGRGRRGVYILWYAMLTRIVPATPQPAGAGAAAQRASSSSAIEAAGAASTAAVRPAAAPPPSPTVLRAAVVHVLEDWKSVPLAGIETFSAKDPPRRGLGEVMDGASVLVLPLSKLLEFFIVVKPASPGGVLRFLRCKGKHSRVYH
jgi:hypothetical protein